MAGTVRIPVGADPWNYKPGSRRRRLEATALAAIRTPEQIAKTDALRKSMHMEFGRKLGVPEDDLELFVSDPNAYGEMLRQRAGQARAITKIEDRKAREAVEGDTDMNHDNVEAAE